MKIEKATDDEPIICTIFAEAGLGKTTLAGALPKPLFLKAEDGLKAIPLAIRADSLPLIKCAGDLWEQLMYVINSIKTDEYKTIVIDTVTTLNSKFIEYIVKDDLNDRLKSNGHATERGLATVYGGYGAGYSALAGMHARVRRAADVLHEKGFNVVFLAHGTTEYLKDLPDSENYTRYSLHLHKDSMIHYVNNVDLVGFIKLETFLLSQDDNKNSVKKAVSDGSRVLVTYTTACNVSKNRYGISGDLMFKAGENPLAEHVKCLRNGV